MRRRILSMALALPALLVGLLIVSAPEATAAASAPTVPTSAEPYLDYTRLFYRTSPWTGGDAHLSVPLGGDRTLWLYGDSGTSPVRPDRWKDCPWCMERNAIAIQQGKDPATAVVNFYFGDPEPGQTDDKGAFFQPPEGDPNPHNNWFWPGDGFRTAQGLYVFLGRAVSDPCCIWGKGVGTYLAHIPNPDDPPGDWNISYQRLPFEVFKGPRQYAWATSVVESGGYLYLYGSRSAYAGAEMVLARALPANAGDFFAWEFYDFASATWITVPRDAPAGSVELSAGPMLSGLYSIHYQPSLSRYVAVYNAVGISSEVYARYSTTLTGPWSEGHLVFRCPEAAVDHRMTCYHGQAHGELSTAGDEVVISYSVMGTPFGTYKDPDTGQQVQKIGQLLDAGYHFPKFVRLRFPGAAGRVEGESLVSSATATAPVSAQTGGPWSGNSQLWFQARQSTDYVEVPVDVASNGVYALSLTQTSGPAYGMTIASVDGQQISKGSFDGYASAVAAATVEHAPVYLAKGRHALRLTVVGKHASSAGYHAGLDQMSVRQVDGAAPFRVEAETMRPPLGGTAPVDVQNSGAWFWWSGTGQLRVNATAAGQYADLPLDVPVSGFYDLTIDQTEGDDYGINTISIDTKQVGASFDAHNAGLKHTQVHYGTVHLSSGRHTLRVNVTGKNASSSGYRTGLDYVDLKPALTTETGALHEDPDDPNDPDDGWLFKPSPGTPVGAQRDVGSWKWSGGGHLWMRSTQAGQYMDMKIFVPRHGFYDLSIAQTEAADYGINTITVDEQPVGQPFDAHSATGQITEVGYGRVRLTEGHHLLRATVTGKNAASSGFFAGIDHVRLRPVGGVAPTDKGPVSWDTYRLLDRLAELPTGVEARSFSSFDRSGGNNDGFDGAYSCLRTLPAAEGGGCVIAEADGAGEITSMWFTRDGGPLTNTGWIKVELDHQTVLNASLANVVKGALPAPTPFKFPLVADNTKSSGGNYIKVPMPYRSKMRVITQHNPRFYQVAYRRFADAAGVPTFNPNDAAQDVIDKLLAAGTADPKPALPGARATTQTGLNVAPGASAQLAQLGGPVEISELKLRMPQVVGPQYQTPVTDDYRSFKDQDPATSDCENEADGCESFSEFTAQIDPANQGVRITLRTDAYRFSHQRSKVFVDNVEAGTWADVPDKTRHEFTDMSFDIPAGLTAGKSSITIRTEAQPMWYLTGFPEYFYWIDSKVGAGYVRTDTLDVGPQHTAAEQAHGYRFVNQAGQGTLKAAYPMTGDAAAIAASNDILTNARLRITFDGVTTVDAPIGEFFGSGLGEFNVRSLMFAMDPGGWYTSWWPMSVYSGATVELVNGSGRQLTGVDASITWAPSYTPLGLASGGRLGRFHATARSAALEDGKDHTFLDVQRRGKLVGVSHGMRGGSVFLNELNFLEGDERVHVDGSPSPQAHGTGTEDYYLGGWYFPTRPFTAPFSGAPADLGNEHGCSFRCIGTYRVQVSDPIPFSSTLRFGIEHGPANDHPGAYDSTAFWYGRADGTAARSDSFDVGKPASETAHGYASFAPPPVTSLTSKFEGDDDTNLTDDLRAETAVHVFKMTVPSGNDGVLLRRLGDQNRPAVNGPDQLVRVYVEGVPVGVWRQPLTNNSRRWLDDSFLLPAAHTHGKGAIWIYLEPLTGSSAWSGARYETYALVR